MISLIFINNEYSEELDSIRIVMEMAAVHSLYPWLCYIIACHKIRRYCNQCLSLLSWSLGVHINFVIALVALVVRKEVIYIDLD